MWWHKKERPLREQLTAAIAKVNDQIDVQRRTPPPFGSFGPRDRSALEELQAELTQLKDALANLGPEDA